MLRGMAKGTRGGSAAETCRERFRDAMAWRREVERELVDLKITFAQWTVLETARELIESTEDAVSQNDVASRAEIDRMTVSQVMKNLSNADLVDRGPDMDGRAYRIWLTKKGERAAKQGSARIQRVSAAWLGKRRARR